VPFKKFEFPEFRADLKKSPLEVTELLYSIFASGPLFNVPAKAVNAPEVTSTINKPE
jgi:hypothetical protein